MEKNTVTLDLKEYNELRDLEKAINANNFICLDNYYNVYRGLNESEVVDILQKKLADVNKELYALKYPKEEETTIKDLRQMGLFALIKWKLRNN